MIRPIPTTRAVLDCGRKCNARCSFCYHFHLGDLAGETFAPKEAIIAEGEAALDRGNDYLDMTGGEPTLHPDMAEIVAHFRNKGIKMCLISNGLVTRDRLHSLLDAGTDDFLMSIHGIGETHDSLVGIPSAYGTISRTLNRLFNWGMRFRFNVVINRHNQHQLYELADEIADYRPRIVNFIFFNAHRDWRDDPRSVNVVADLDIVEARLSRAIKHLESKGIGVNVRYYPMCRIAPEYRRCVSNDLHVAFQLFDPGIGQDINCEWDYCILPKTYEKYYEYWLDQTMKVEEKGEPCRRCDLQWICGGMNRYTHHFSNEAYGERLAPVSAPEIQDKMDFYHYRRGNVGIIKL